MASVADKRREYILEELKRNQQVRVSNLSERFGVSEVSIRRDLGRLEKLGLLKRVHGGAVTNPSAGAGPTNSAKRQRYIEEKERIARAAAELIREGDRLIFDSGTTVAHLARNLPAELLNSGNLTVITNSMPVVQELGFWKGVELILLGGIYLAEYETAVGPQTVSSLKGLHADKMFLGTDGLSFSHGLTTANVLEAEVDKAMVEAAGEIIVVADSSKIGIVGLATIMPLARIDKLITDTNAPEGFVTALREQGVEVSLV